MFSTFVNRVIRIVFFYLFLAVAYGVNRKIKRFIVENVSNVLQHAEIVKIDTVSLRGIATTKNNNEIVYTLVEYIRRTGKE